MQSLTAVSVFLALASALLLYGLSYDTRLIEADVQGAERQSERLRSDIAVMRAERAHLSRPERIGPMARSLGLRPTEAHQIAPVEASRVAAAEAATGH